MLRKSQIFVIFCVFKKHGIHIIFSPPLKICNLLLLVMKHQKLETSGIHKILWSCHISYLNKNRRLVQTCLRGHIQVSKQILTDDTKRVEKVKKCLPAKHILQAHNGFDKTKIISKI